MTLEVIYIYFYVVRIISVKFESNQSIVKIWPQVSLWPQMALKVSSIYLECYKDHFCQI